MDCSCPNVAQCKLISDAAFVIPKEKKDNYLDEFCRSTTEKWKDCKRYLTRLALNFCPDFVLPDTQMTIDEIIDEFDSV